MSEEQKGFTTVDRRAFRPDGTQQDSDGEKTGRVEGEQAAKEETPEEERGGGREVNQAKAPRDEEFHLPPVDFSSFMLSLAHTAMVHLGALPDPMTGEDVVRLPLARHTIDTIAMLKDKTQGNLDKDEQRLLDSTLTELRLAYVRLSR